MVVTFGSVGDIISVSLLVKDILVALDDSRGSSTEYQEVIRELYILDRALLQIEQLSKEHEATPELVALCQTARKAVDDCRIPVEAFIEKIQKYGRSLSARSKGNALSKAARRMQFSMEKKQIAEFRAEIAAHSLSLNMLLTTASAKLMTIHDKKTENRLEHNARLTRDALARHDAALAEIRSRIYENNQLVATANTTCNGIADALRLQWLRDLGSGLKSMVSKIFLVNMRTYRTVLSIEAKLPNLTERCMVGFQTPILFEDARGRPFPIHPQLIDTWDIFDLILETKFKGIPGFQKVKRKEYILQDRSRSRDIERTLSFKDMFLPGQRIDMSVVFTNVQQDATTSVSCPGCQFVSEAANPGGSHVCTNCSLIFCRITEELPTAGQCAVPTPAVPRTRKRAAVDDDQIADFKRVRLIAQVQRKAEEKKHRPKAQMEDKVPHPPVPRIVNASSQVEQVLNQIGHETIQTCGFDISDALQNRASDDTKTDSEELDRRIRLGRTGRNSAPFSEWLEDTQTYLNNKDLNSDIVSSSSNSKHDKSSPLVGTKRRRSHGKIIDDDGLSKHKLRRQEHSTFGFPRSPIENASQAPFSEHIFSSQRHLSESAEMATKEQREIGLEHSSSRQASISSFTELPLGVFDATMTSTPLGLSSLPQRTQSYADLEDFDPVNWVFDEEALGLKSWAPSDTTKEDWRSDPVVEHLNDPAEPPRPPSPSRVSVGGWTVGPWIRDDIRMPGSYSATPGSSQS